MEQVFNRLREALVNPFTSTQQVGTMMTTIYGLAEKGSIKEKNEILTHLAQFIEHPNPEFSVLIALFCGSIIENGANPLIAYDNMTVKLDEFLTEALFFFNEGFDEDSWSDGGFEKKALQNAVRLYPKQYTAWLALEKFYLPIVAVLSRSKETRRRLRESSSMMEKIAMLSGYNTGASWLSKIIQVIDDEEILILHPQEKKGFIVKISGITDNHQLDILLSDAIMDTESGILLSGEKPEPDLVRLARDSVDPDELQGVTGNAKFMMFSWRALMDDTPWNTAKDEIPKDENLSLIDHYVPGSGSPAEFTKFNGTRIILLRETPWTFGITSPKVFGSMLGELELVRILDQSEVEDWMNKIALEC